MKNTTRSLVLFLSIALFVGSGCDSSSSETTDTSSTIRVWLTDAPLATIVEANVIIEQVELRGPDNRIVVLADAQQPFDLLTLQDGITTSLADLEIADGTYNQVRIVVSEEATLLFDDGTEENLKIPSGSQSGIKINLPNLVLTGDVVDVTIDFDLEDSFVQRGNSGKGYIFKPVLKPLSVRINGEVVPIGDDG